MLSADNPLVKQWGLAKSGKAKILNNSPVLVTRTVDHTAWLDEPLLKGSDVLTVPRSLAFKKRGFLTLQDCRYLLIDQISQLKKVNGSDVITLRHDLPFDFNTGAMIGHFTMRAYYLSKTGLYVQNTQGRRYELVPDVHLNEVATWLK